jgi:hypothetical protein
MSTRMLVRWDTCPLPVTLKASPFREGLAAFGPFGGPSIQI